MASTKTWIELRDEGTQHFKNHDWIKASDCYTRALSMKPGEAVLYSNRAICEIQLKKFELAREDAESAVRLDPQNAKSYRFLSEALVGLKSYEKALEACEKGLMLQPREITLLVRQEQCKSKISGSKSGHDSEPMKNGDQDERKKKPEILLSTPASGDVDLVYPRDVDMFCKTIFHRSHSPPSKSDEKINLKKRDVAEPRVSEGNQMKNSDLEEEYCNDPKVEMFTFLKSLDGSLDPCLNHSPVVHDPKLLIPAMGDRLVRGWPSAKLFFDALKQMYEALELLRQKKFTESFVKVREMMKTWNLKTFDPTLFLEAAETVLKKEPDNHAAMHIILIFGPDRDSKHSLKLAKRCLKLSPGIPEYHSIVSAFYVKLEQGNQALRNLEKSIKMQPHPQSMFLKASILQNLICAKDDIVVEAFQQFLSSVPPDYEDVPAAFFYLGFLHSEKSPAKAAFLYRLGQIADHSSIRLPCFPNAEDDVMRMKLKINLRKQGYWPIPKDALASVKMCFTCTKTEPLSPCTTCNKAWYCSKKCQNNNVIIHKQFCRQ
jgi:tetratricopeptide (TPR) repeat protein